MEGTSGCKQGGVGVILMGEKGKVNEKTACIKSVSRVVYRDSLARPWIVIKTC